MIAANFKSYNNYVVDSLYQWDLNQRLTVAGLNIAVAPEIHFSNANLDRAIVRQSKMENHIVTVDIPNSLLQHPLRIFAHIGIYDGNTFKVIETVEIPVIPRKKPADYMIENSDDEIYSFKALEYLLSNALTKTEGQTINARIDTIIANANKTDGNSELVDMRIDANGTTHTSAGKALRNWQIKTNNAHSTAIGFIYCGYGNDVVFTELSGGSLQIDFPCNLTLIAPSNNGVTIDWNTSISDVTKYVVVNGDNSVTLTMPYRTCFVYNVTDKLYHIRPLSYLVQGDIIVINNIYQSPVSGSIVNEYLWNEAKKLNEKIDDVDEKIDNFVTESNVPLTIDDKVKTFSALFNDSGDIESFIFFTDPHLKKGADWHDKINAHLESIKTVYDSAPVTFCMSGGDWLNDNDTVNEACSALGFIDSQMRKFFDEYYLIVGNHDTNYQGILEDGSNANTGKLTKNTINNLWFRKTGKSYYTFNGQNTTFFVFDTGIDWNATFDDYSFEQVLWYADKLKDFTGEHIAIAVHMVHINETNTFNPLTDKICEISNAFNNRSTVTIGDKIIDFSTANGKVEFMLAGHNHADLNGKLHEIPYFMTTMSVSGYDMVLVDYTARQINLIRIGNGSDRVIDL